jgi:ubiquinone/menaquinone biosynthesis C-methylase UbiE
MDTADDAREYDAMDHSAVNQVFVNDLLAALEKGDWSIYHPTHATLDSASKINGPVPFFEPHQPLRILDLGAGTAQILIELASRAPHVHITAADAAASMLELARANIAAANLTDRIEPVLADAKALPFGPVGWAPPTSQTANRSVGNAHPTSFDAVISNSIVHHIPEPRAVIAEAIRVTAPGGLLFHRDLARPADEPALQQLVDLYAHEATPYQRRLFAESLHAALTAEEMADLIASFGFDRTTVKMTSDRHWTWCATK